MNKLILNILMLILLLTVILVNTAWAGISVNNEISCFSYDPNEPGPEFITSSAEDTNEPGPEFISSSIGCLAEDTNEPGPECI